MTPTQRKAMEQALEALEMLTDDYDDGVVGLEIDAIVALRTALAEQPAEQVPFQPDWVNYRQGLRDGWTEGYEQGIADERTSEANIGIAGFDAKVHPARVNPYESTAPQPAKPAEQEPNIPGLAADPSAFVRWASKAGYDMTSHPLHFLFLNEKTAAARDGWKAACARYTAPQPAKRVPLTPRELELIDGMIEMQLIHAERCDVIANRRIAAKQKEWDMERVELLRKIRAHGITGEIE